MATLLIFLDGSVVNTAMPAIARDFTANNSTLQWVVNMYGLILAGFLLVGGNAGDRFGRKKFLAAGLSVFGLASLGAAASQDSATLIAMRGLQGLGSAMALPATLSIITDVFPRGERARAIAIWTGVSSMGLAIGPAVGGWLVDEVSWQAVFWLQIPFVAIALLGARFVPDSRDSRRLPLDIPGAILGTAGVLAVVYAIVQGGEEGWTSGSIIAGFIGGVALLAAFGVVEATSKAPMLPARYLRDKSILGPFFVLMILFIGMMGVFFFLTQFLQLVQGRSALVAGLAIVPVTAAMMVSAGITSKALPVIGPRAVVTTGSLIVLAGIGLHAQVELGSGYWVAVLAMVLMGLGAGMVMPTVTDTIMASVDVNDAGVGSALNDLSRELGIALGVAVLGTLVTNVYRSRVVDDLRGLVPGGVADRIGDSLAAVGPVTADLGAEVTASASVIANESFVEALRIGYWGAFAFVAVAIALTLWLLPSKMRTQQVESETIIELGPDPEFAGDLAPELVE
jgi:EmrB/QacA subfamily drug resistance transporter